MAKEVTFSIKGLADLDVSQFTQQLDRAKTALGKLSMPQGVENSFTSLFKKLNDQILDFEQKSKRTFGSMSEIKAAEKSYAKLQQYIEDFNFALSKIDMSKLSMKDAGSVKGLQEGLQILRNFEARTQETTREMSKLQSQLSKKLQSKIDVSALVEAASSGQELHRQLQGIRNANTRLRIDTSDFEEAEKRVREIDAQLTTARLNRDKLYETAKKTGTQEDKDAYQAQRDRVRELVEELNKAESAQKKLTNSQKAFEANVEILDKIEEAYKKLQALSSVDFSQIFGGDSPDIQPIRNLVQALEQLKTINLDSVKQPIKEASSAMGDLGEQAKNAGASLRAAADSGTELTRLNNQVEQLKNNFLDFFSLTNGWYLLQRAIRSAYDTVKELDDSMTEIAVVSDYSLDDIWALRGQYSEEATKLGAQTIDLVDATKLYVQQGLTLNEAMEVGIETTKMARIANLDGAEATNLMTAALRGFNMEMQQANEVNDVYSELAAITAADTQEIAVAMSKTASIANNAGSSFENMSAFLAQIIETTREAPETAGTAMKTIIARFQELKKPMDEIGEVDGEIVDANKIETALREAGVALRDVNGEFRNFDDVILELASKWDTLDIMTQRYIATQAAGSRQQSRFLALMSDQERLMELVGAANNAQGSANRQYEKTLDSLQSKVNELNNALDIFWTNLANNTVIKTVIELLTLLLNIVNKLVGVFSQSESGIMQFVGSIVQVALLYAAFKGATKLIQSFSASVVGTMGKAGTDASTSFITNLKNGFNGLKGVSKEIQAQIANAFSENKGFTRGSGKTDKAMNFLDFGNTFKGLNDKQFKKIMNPKMIKSLQADIYESLNFSNLGPELQSQIDAAFNKMVASIQAGGEKAKNAFRELQADLNNIEVTTTTTNSNGEQVQQTNKGVGQATVSTDTQALALRNAQLQKTQQVLMGVSAAAGAASLGISSLASYLDSIGNSTGAEVLSGVATVLGILTAVLGIASPLMMTFGATTAAAGVTAQVGWAPFLPILYAIMAVIAVVGLLFVGLSAAIETDAEKIEKLNNVLDETQAEIDAAKQSLEELNTQKDELTTMNDDLANLTRGTAAWKEQLIAVNQQVLSLISTYPGLAAYLERGKDGQLAISDEGFDALIKDQEDRIVANQTAQLGARQQLTYLETQQDIKQFRRDTMGAKSFDENGNIEASDGWNTFNRVMVGISTLGLSELAGAITGTDTYNRTLHDASILTTGISDAQYQEIAVRMAEEGLSAQRPGDEQAIKDIFTEVGGSEIYFDNFYHQITTLGSSFDELANNAFAASEAMEAERDAMIDSAITNSEELSESDYSEQAALYADLNYDDMGAMIEEEVGSMGKGVSDELKDEYAEISGLTKDEINAKLEDKSLSEETIKQTVASNRVQEEMTGNMEKVNAEFNRLAASTKNTDLEDDFKALQGLMTEDAAGITQRDINNILSQSGATDVNTITDDQINAYLSNLGTSLDQLGISAEQFRQQLIMGQETFDDANNSLEAWSIGGTLGESIEREIGDINKILNETFDADLTAGQLESFNNIMMGIASRGGDTSNFANSLEEILGIASTDLENPEDLAQVMSILTSTDWSDSAAIEEAMKQLEGLGLEIDGDLTDKLIDTSAAIRDVGIEQLNEALIGLGDAIDLVIGKIEAGESSFTQEEYDQLIAQGIDPDSFTRNGADEYYYNGSDLKDVQLILENNQLEIEQETQDTLQQKIDNAQGFNDYFGKNYGWNANDGDKQWTNEEFVSAIIEGTVTPESSEKGGYTVNRDQLLDMVKELEITTDKPLEEYGDEGLVELIKQWYNNFYLTQEQNKAELEGVKQTISDLQMMELDSAGAVAAAGGSEEQQIAKANQQVQEAGLSTGDLSFFTDELQRQNEALRENEALATRVAASNMLMNDGLSEIIESYGDWSSLIDETSGLISVTGAEDAAIYDKLRKSVNKMLNTSEDLSEEFWNNAENMENIKKAAEGDTEALGKLQKAATKDYLVNLALDPNNNFSEDAINAILTLSDFIEGYELPKLNAGDILDDQEFIARCNELIAASGMTAEQVSSAFMSMGYDVEFDPNPQTVTEKQVVPVTTYSVSGSMTDGTLKMIPSVSMEEYEYESTVAAPTIKTLTSTGSMGGGVSTSNVNAGSSNKPSGGGGGGGGGGGSEPEDPWEADYDWLYNLVNKTEEETRNLTKLQWEYDKAVRASGTSARELLRNLEEQEESLKRQQQYYQQQQSGRYEELRRVQAEYSDVGQYAWYNESAGYVEIDWDAIDALSGTTGNNETGERIDEYIARLEEIQDQIDETEDALMDIEDQIAELDEQGWDEYVDLEQRIFDAIVQLRQDEIDKLTELNESINEANTKMLEKIQTGIDDYRNARQLEEDAENIQDMEGRLALMQSDTSGANALDILALQEELQNARQSYTDSLIDKSIEEMTRQNEQAYEQRQMQIDLMIAQLEWDQESGAIAQQTNELMTEYLKNGPTDMINLLKDTELFNGMAAAEKEDWIETIEDAYAAGMASWVRNHYVKDTGKQITFTDSNGVKRTGTIVGEGQVKVGNTTYSGVYQTPDGGFTQELEGGSTTQTPAKPSTPPASTNTNNNGATIPSKGWGVTVKKGAKFKDGQSFNESVRVSGFDPKHKGGFYIYQQSGNYYLLGNGGPSRAPNWTGWVHKQYLTPYATGGLADFTGPAWLDGSKAHPELVLNARDTENFIQLKNILADGFNGKGSSGDNYYDVHIEVDQLSNDYDVEQMMDKMKRLIEEDAAYRNVNAVDLGRR